MSASQDQKKRPPPIALPPLPHSRHLPGPNAFAIAAQTTSENQHNGPTSKESGCGDKQSAPTSAHQGLPSSQMSDAALPRSNSQKSRGRSHAFRTLSNLIDQARGSPRKSDYASSASASSRHYSTTQSKYSDRNQHAAMAAQAQLEALDEDDRMSRSNKSTTRSRHSDRSAHRAMAAQAHLEIANQDDRTSRSLIEARSERKLFKMMGQVPPTPVDGVAEIPDSYIKTSDLRSQYKSQESEKEQPEKEPPKSPRKKLFGVSLPMFNRASSSGPTPSMPSKAAQVLGTDPKRKPHKIEVRPIKPSGYVRPAIKTPRSDTSKSLPSKLYESQSHSRRQHVGATRRNRTVGRKGHVPHITHITHNKAIDALAELSRRSSSPPTPPEKDTPPESKPKVQHVRQHSLNHPCDEGEAVDAGMKLEFPSIGSAPTLKPKLPAYGTDSPAKFQPYTASDYVKLVERDCIHSTYAQIERVKSTDIRQGHFQRMTLDSENVDPQDTPCAVGLSGGIYCEKRLDLSPDGHLLPRFYSPTDRSPQEFPQGGSPSKNTDPDRLLFVLRPKSNIQHMVETLGQGSGPKNMVPQGEANPLGPESATNKTINSTVQETTSPQKNGDLGSAAQEPRVAEKKEVVMRGGGGGQTGQLQPDHSFSGLSDMFNTLSPFRPGLDRNFTPNCPSAVPSPLNRAPRQQPSPSGNMRVPQTTPRTPKSMEDHFFMTNEHVDVAAKILHDFVAKCHQQEVNTVASKHEQLITKLEHHVEDIKSQINSVSEKADHISNQNHNVNVKLDKLLGFIKSEVVEPLNTQTKRTADMEVHMKELQKTMKNLQSSMEQKLAETRSSQPMTTGTYPTPVTAQSSYPLMGHRTQPSMVGYFDSPTQDSGGDGSGRLPHAQESTNMTAGSDAPRGDNRGRYGGAYNQNWHPRAKDETHPFSGSNPYHLAGNGQYGSGYMGGYPLGFSPTPPGQQYPFPPPNAPK